MERQEVKEESEATRVRRGRLVSMGDLDVNLGMKIIKWRKNGWKGKRREERFWPCTT